MNKKRVICAGNGLAALNLAANIDADTEVWIIATEGLIGSNSFKAKGGVAIPVSREDTLQHITDTLIAGDGLCDHKVVEDVIGNANQVLMKLEKGGFRFDRTIGKEGGHHANRIRHVGDETGKYLTAYVAARVKQRTNVQLMYNYTLLGLWMDGDVCKGVEVGNRYTNTIEKIGADAVVLATGGCGSLYQHHSNGKQANGEGYAIAYRAGAAITNIEFMQFHPTLLWRKNPGDSFLVTEAFRGAGAVLRDLEMKEFMSGVHDMGSLAPRDIVSLTIFRYLTKTGAPHVWLDFNRVDPLLFQTEFPALYQLCEEEGFMSAGLIPVVPAAHYMCGGVKTNLYGETNISNLYAVGEVGYTGLHGANRLASNSLLELMFVSERAAERINESGTLTGKTEVISTRCYTDDNLVHKLEHIQTILQSVMWNYFGISRNESDMEKGMEKLYSLKQELLSVEKHSSISILLKQLSNRIQTALLIGQSALSRKESKGCHFREDGAGCAQLFKSFLRC